MNVGSWFSIPVHLRTGESTVKAFLWTASKDGVVLHAPGNSNRPPVVYEVSVDEFLTQWTCLKRSAGSRCIGVKKTGRAVFP